MKTRQRLTLAGVALFAVLILSVVMLGSAGDAPRFRPSDNAAYLPEEGESFESYLVENQRRIRRVLNDYYYDLEELPFGSDLALERVLEMRMPFEYPPAPDCEGSIGQGFLLVHGLTDSPYLLRAVADSLHSQFPCSLVRSLLSPGHGTIPGDLLNVKREQWEAVFAWGVETTSPLVNELNVLGYSNGSALAINYLNNRVEAGSQTIDRLILISPGLQPADSRAWLAPYLKFVRPWIYQRDDRDAVKYESFPTNAAAEFYSLTQDVTNANTPVLRTPTLMIVSGDDTTTDAEVAASLFCEKIDSPSKQLIWYQSESVQSELSINCDGIRRLNLSETNLDSRVISLSHVALTTPPEDDHYGIDGRYPVCLSHEENAQRLNQCITDDLNSVYAESTFMDEDGLFESRIVRRTSFNPLFEEMMMSIGCFVRGDCTE